MRIIAGTARNTKLQALEGQQTRPTLERVKEAMFSSVQFLLPGADVLDLFAGCGQLGLEALSRGAANCVLVDQSKQACGCIRNNLAACGFGQRAGVVQSDAEAYVAGCRHRFSIVLLDPPYGYKHLEPLLRGVASICAEDGVVLCECGGNDLLPQQCAGLVLQKRYRYGSVQLGRYVMEQMASND